MSDRKFCIWEWNGVPDKQLMMEVRMRWGSEAYKDLIKTSSSSLDDKSMPTFYVELHHPPTTVESGDLRDLAQRVVAILEAYHKVEWHPKLVVSINKARDDEDSRMTARLEIVIQEAATAVIDGQPYYRQPSRYMRSYDYHKGELLPATKPSRYGHALVDEKFTLLGVVEDTPANREALLNISRGLGELRARLTSFMSGDDALQKALAMSAIKLLAPQLKEAP